jgi:hypothetical protein
LREVVSAWQGGAISRDTMLELFRKGEILPDGRTNKDEVALIEGVNVRQPDRNGGGMVLLKK